MKTKYSQMNNKRFYFPNGVVSVHWEIFSGRKRGNVTNGKKTLKNHPGLYILHQILMSQPEIININQKK